MLVTEEVSTINSSWMRTLLSKPLFAYFKSGETITKSGQGTKLTFLARSHLAPKFSKVVAKAKKLGAIKKR